jgi:hypothetical protein
MRDLGKPWLLEEFMENIAMSWILDLGSIGKFGEEVGRLGGLVAGGTRAEHWPKSKECLPR